ncbi:MAG: GNAT family N-acetyltransferase [Candidatus Cloacimonetes bacterium]|nr:GNAT family N-acetyltransferase [Candidatus Cloacimonadota bacterium]MBT4331639.1 GNAT family N-acetyltransferase [Candidatus Cloacimonadota bacterium]MBT4576602.1 GNAT family N-acetyltransferase [Candidatus Cloacimonadota bacterium]
MRSDIEIREPKTKLEFEKYYDLRWWILRKPWNQPKGSEQDEMDEDSIHVMAINGEKVIGCGRGHLNSKVQSQIRYMAVEKEYRGHGVGSRLLQALEKKIFEAGAKKIILKAREKAVPLYERHGYQVYEKGEILFGEIKHYWMRKNDNRSFNK